MKKKLNRYQLVHHIAQLAKELEQADKYPVADKKNTYIKEVNNAKERRNYPLEAYNQIMKEQENAEEARANAIKLKEEKD